MFSDTEPFREADSVSLTVLIEISALFRKRIRCRAAMNSEERFNKCLDAVAAIPACVTQFKGMPRSACRASASAKTLFHKARAIRLTRIMAAARTKKASAEDAVASWSRANLRQRAIQPKLRSMTHRLGCTAKPFWPSLGSTISTVMVVAAPTRSPRWHGRQSSGPGRGRAHARHDAGQSRRGCRAGQRVRPQPRGGGRPYSSARGVCARRPAEPDRHRARLPLPRHPSGRLAHRRHSRSGRPHVQPAHGRPS